MALTRICVYSRQSYNLVEGQSVYLCLPEVWSSRTVDGSRLLFSTYIRSYSSSNTTTCPNTSSCPNTIKYLVEYNDELLLDDPSTGEPWVLNGCSDVLSIIGDVCLVNAVNTGLDIIVVSEDPGNIITDGSDGGAYLDCDAVASCAGDTFSFSITGDVGTPEEVASGNTVSILGGTACHSMVAAPDTIILDVDISTDAGQVITIGTDGGLLVVGGGGGPIDCEDINNCINVDGFITGTGSVGDPYIVFPSSDPGNTASIGTDNGVYTPTDVMADNGTTSIGGTLARHTAANGANYSFATGFNSVTSNSACASPGVAANKMVRDVTMSGQTLTIDAAPEHTTLTIGASFLGSPGSDISSLGTINSGTSSLLNINNASCRDIRGIVNLYWAAAVALEVTGVWKFDGLLSVNGGPYDITSSTQWGVYPGLTGTVWLMYAPLVYDIPAGSVLSLRWAMNLTTLVASSPGSVWSQFYSGLNFIGGTV